MAKNESEYAVHLQKDGVTESFLPGDDIPAWAAKLITNPLVTGKATEDKEAESVEPVKKAPAKKAPTKASSKESDES